MKKFLAGLILTTLSLFGQTEPDNPPVVPIMPFRSEIISFPRVDGEFSVYYTFKVPYRLLVFERNDNSFIAGFRIIVEILDDDSRLVTRDIKDSKVSVNNFDSTNDNNLFLQNFLSFKVKPGEYKVAAFISDKNSSGELPLKPVELILEEDKVVLHPLVIKTNELICEEQKSFELTNAGGKIPFSSETYHLIIPVRDTSVSQLTISIENNEEEIISTELNEFYILPPGINKCEEQISVTKNQENLLVKNFILHDVNKNLSEGEVVLTVVNEEKSIDEEFRSQIVWFNKPFSLMDPEKAIENLSFIASDSIIYTLLQESTSDYPNVLSEYWKKYDPTPETVFNEVMSEYYKRIDYAIKEFKGIGKINGAKTDRGVVYIKFGHPEKIERSSNSMGQIVETWTYAKPDRIFSFIDKDGKGNFNLSEN